ncbi:MarR family winged helix-turn-helix transcriptional regulator [Dubosiella newyorkensis]|uniref:MarR family winged helix-turn-helix transcriptional regulator n=1 Tax=Dubosiella newyorkensis TaxID=1862672 RepID=UPI00248B4C39|nr:MarR family transcriptional regulator [Dubosiella newyorkensis]
MDKNGEASTLDLLLTVLARVRKIWKDELSVYPYLKARDLTILDWVYHSKSPITMQDLATHLHVSPAAVTQMVANYEKRGLLQKVPSQIDHRMNTLQLHPELVKRIEGQRQLLKKQLENFEAFIDHEFDLNKLLSKLAEFFEQEDEKTDPRP